MGFDNESILNMQSLEADSKGVQPQTQQAESSAATTQVDTKDPSAVAVSSVELAAVPGSICSHSFLSSTRRVLSRSSVRPASTAGATTTSTMAVASFEAPTATNQGQVVAPKTQTAEQYQQHYSRINRYTNQYHWYGQYRPYNTQQYQTQVPIQNVAQFPAQPAPYAQPQFLQLSQPQHMVSNQSQNPQVQAPLVQPQPQQNPPLNLAPRSPQMHSQGDAYSIARTQVGNQPFAMPTTQAIGSQVQPHIQPDPPQYLQGRVHHQHPQVQLLFQQHNRQSQMKHQHQQVQQHSYPQPQVYHQPQNPPVNWGAVAPQTQIAEQYQQHDPHINPYTRQYKQFAQPQNPPAHWVAVAPQTQRAEQYEQHYPHINLYQQYGINQQYTTQQYQTQVSIQNVAQFPAQPAPYAQPQFMQLSQPQHMVPNQSQNPQVQAPIVQPQLTQNPPLSSAPQSPQHPALVHPPEGQFLLQGQQPAMQAPQGTQHRSEHQQNVGYHVQQPSMHPSFPSQAPPQGFPVNTSVPSQTGQLTSGSHPQILLEKNCSIGYLHNSTTSKCEGSRGLTVEVSFKLASPPALSQCFVCAYDLTGSRLAGEPVIRGTAGSFVLLSIHISGNGICPPYIDFFVYRAGPGIPSLHHVPRPYPTNYLLDMVCILPISDDSNHFALVFPILEYFMLECRNHWTLHTYHSDGNIWCKKVALMAEDEETENSKIQLLSFNATNVVYAGAGLVGWVDLWWGILLCPVLDENPTVRFIQLPVPEDWNSLYEFRSQFDFSPRPNRHLAIYNGLIKFIMLKFHKDRNNSDQGWVATMWTRSIDSNFWHEECTVDTANLSAIEYSFLNVLPEILDDKKLTWQKISSGGPTLSLHDDIFYIMAKVNLCDPAAFVLAINTTKLRIECCVECSAKSMFGFEPNCVPCVFSSYFSTSAVSELTEEQPETLKCEVTEEQPETLKCEVTEEQPETLKCEVTEKQPETPECWNLVVSRKFKYKCKRLVD